MTTSRRRCSSSWPPRCRKGTDFPDLEVITQRLVVPLRSDPRMAQVLASLVVSRDEFGEAVEEVVDDKLGELPDFDDFVKQDDLPDVSNYVEEDDLPDFDDFVKREDLQNEIEDQVPEILQAAQKQWATEAVRDAINRGDFVRIDKLAALQEEVVDLRRQLSDMRSWGLVRDQA